MFYHVKLSYLSNLHGWWDLSKEEVIESILIPFVNGQVIPVTLGENKSLLNMKNVALLRIYKTENRLSQKDVSVTPKEFTSDKFETNECTDELINEVRELQASTQSTSLLQKALAIPQKQVFCNNEIWG